MKLAEYMSLFIVIAFFLILLLRLDLVTGILDDEGINRGEFFIGMFIILGGLLTVLFAYTFRR